MWAIWSNWNKYTYDEIKFQPIRLMELIREMIQALDIPTSAVAVQKPREGWNPQYVGWVKINTDGAVDAVELCSGAGVVVGNHTGQFLARRMCKFQSVTIPVSVNC